MNLLKRRRLIWLGVIKVRAIHVFREAGLGIAGVCRIGQPGNAIPRLLCIATGRPPETGVERIEEIHVEFSLARDRPSGPLVVFPKSLISRIDVLPISAIARRRPDDNVQRIERNHRLARVHALLELIVIA